MALTFHTGRAKRFKSKSQKALEANFTGEKPNPPILNSINGQK